MFLFGPGIWLARGEAFALMASVLARFSPTARRVTDKDICLSARGSADAKSGCSDCIAAFRAPRDALEINLRPFGGGLIRSQPLPFSMTVLVIIVLAMTAFEWIHRSGLT